MAIKYQFMTPYARHFITCDSCDQHAPKADTGQEAMELALQNGFSRVTFWTGLEYAIRYFCADCLETGLQDLRQYGKEPQVVNYAN